MWTISPRWDNGNRPVPFISDRRFAVSSIAIAGLLLAWSPGVTQAAADAAGQVPARSRPRLPPHPLDPLGAVEIAATVRALRAHPDVPANAFFPTIALDEPPKDEVRAFRPGRPFRRNAFAVVFDWPTNRTWEAIVDLSTNAVKSMRRVTGVQPAILMEEFDRVPALVRADPAFREAMRKRGIANVDDVQIDVWAPGLLDPKTEPATTRWARAVAFLKGKQQNGYARPIEGVVVLVNLTTGRVERLINLGISPVAPQTADLDVGSIGPLRDAPRPLRHVQPLGPSFSVSGHEVRRQKWRLRYSMHPREGLVLHVVGYEDQGRVTPILYRASISEMLVPYADPTVTWSFRNAFDEGEYGLGRLAGTL